MQNAHKLALMILAVTVFLSFFMPWVKIDAPVVGGISKILTGKAQSSISDISGFDVPIMANGPDSRFALAVIKIFNPSVKDADKKSWLIWGVPIFGVMLALASVFFGKFKWLRIAIAVICVAIFAVAVFKIKTTDMNKLVLNVKIAHGLWLTLWGYFGIGIVNALNLIKGGAR
jgi:hypothetical protein